MAETYCDADDVKLKAGVSAATLTAAQYTSLINEAEAQINHEMGKDYIADYSTYDDSVKLILQRLCSCMAANHAIAYDQANFLTGEITNLLNVNENAIQECYRLLRKDDDTATAVKDGY